MGSDVPRVLLVHERFTELGGSEKVVNEFATIWPSARLFAPIADRSVIPEPANQLPLRTSPLQYLYRGDGRYSHLLPLLGPAMATAPSRDADLVVISHHAFANRARVHAEIPSISYVHSPARWMWDSELRALELGSGLAKHGLSAFAWAQRRSDRRAAQRITRLIANSTTVAERIEQWWGREATVVFPPVDTTFYQRAEAPDREDFVLLAGRLVPYKRPDLAVAAAAQAGVRLVVAGQGRAEAACRAVAASSTTFLGDVSDGELRSLFQRCRGLIFAGVEDFGMIPVEAQACGAPVLGVDRGGLTDSVIDRETGLLVPYTQDRSAQIELLREGLIELVEMSFDEAQIRRHAERFGADRFRSTMADIAADVVRS